MVVTSVLDRIRRVAVRAGVPAFLNSIGLLGISYRTYWRIISYLHHGDVIERSFGDVQAVFKSNDWKEMRHLHGDFEEEILVDLYNHLNTNDVFFDVGAHIGIYTCLVAQAVDEGSVVAFEPNPNMRSRLEKNLKLNQVSNVSVFSHALSDENMMGSIDGWDVQKNEQSSQMINLIRGDSIINDEDLHSPSVVKIDVEGGELMVLDGLQTSLEKYCRLIYVEVHPDMLEGGSPQDVESKLQSLGFEVIQLNSTESDIHYLRGQKSF